MHFLNPLYVQYWNDKTFICIIEWHFPTSWGLREITAWMKSRNCEQIEESARPL